MLPLVASTDIVYAIHARVSSVGFQYTSRSQHCGGIPNPHVSTLCSHLPESTLRSLRFAHHNSHTARHHSAESKQGMCPTRLSLTKPSQAL
eukprot:4696239-Pyramimonas_sp.AAC.2